MYNVESIERSVNVNVKKKTRLSLGARRRRRVKLVKVHPRLRPQRPFARRRRDGHERPAHAQVPRAVAPPSHHRRAFRARRRLDLGDELDVGRERHPQPRRRIRTAGVTTGVTAAQALLVLTRVPPSAAAAAGVLA